MAEQFYTILTATGKAKIVNSNVLGTKINLSTLVVGDSNGSYYNPIETQEGLVNEVWRGNIQSIAIDKENPNWIVIESIIPSNIGGFMIREVGALDEEGNLIVIAKYPETYKPIASDGATKDIRIRIILEVSNAANVTLKINPAVIFATKEDLQNVENQIKNINVPVESVNGKTGEIELTAEDIKCKNGQSVETQMAQSAKEIENLKSSVGSGKDGLYSAIIGKKVTPRSKDFDDLKTAINSIKLGSGNAVASNVLSSKTFTNDSGIMQTGTMPNRGAQAFTPSKDNKYLPYGYYNGTYIRGDANLIADNIAEGVSIFGVAGNIPKYSLPLVTGGYTVLMHGTTKSTDSDTFKTMWKFRANAYGNISISFRYRTDNDRYSIYAAIYVNNKEVAYSWVGREYYVDHTEEIKINKGDIIEVKLRASREGDNIAYMTDLEIKIGNKSPLFDEIT